MSGNDLVKSVVAGRSAIIRLNVPCGNANDRHRLSESLFSMTFKTTNSQHPDRIARGVN